MFKTLNIMSFVLSFIGIANASAEVMDFPVQTAKYPEAKDAGIASFHVTRDGETAAAEAFNEEGEPIANCEAQWRDESRALTCTLADGGRYRAIWYADRAEFEDLRTGDHIEVYKREGQIEPEPGESDRGGWVVRGTKTWEEVERDWWDTSAILGSFMPEIEFATGIRAERWAKRRSRRHIE